MRRLATVAVGALAVALAAGAAMADTPGVTATEIKIGNTVPYSGPASSYGVIGKTGERVLRHGERAGRRCRPQDRFHLAR